MNKYRQRNSNIQHFSLVLYFCLVRFYIFLSQQALRHNCRQGCSSVFYGTKLIDLLHSEQDNLPLASDSEQQNDKFISLSQISILQNNTSTTKPNMWLPFQTKTKSEKEYSATFPIIWMKNKVRILLFFFSYLSFPLTLYTVYHVNTDPLWGPVVALKNTNHNGS